VSVRSSRDDDDPAVSPDGDRIAFTEWDACEGGTADVKLSVVDAHGRPGYDLEQLPGNRWGARDDYWAPVWSPTGAQIAFLDQGDLRIAARDGSHVRRLAQTSLSIWEDDGPPAWSSDGTWLAFTKGYGANGDLYVVHPDGSGLRRVTNTRAAHHSPTWVYQVPR
jgi:TolB protein